MIDVVPPVNKVAVLMPGLVSPPRAGVLRSLAEHYPETVAILDVVDQMADDHSISKISTRLVNRGGAGPDSVDAHYLEILAVSLTVFTALLAEGLRPYTIIGHSLGELAALVAGGAISVGDAAVLTLKRSQALTNLGWDGVMLAVGVDGERARHLVEIIDIPDLAVACENSPHQSVLAGPRDAIDIAEGIAERLHWPHRRLDLPHATHSPALAAASAELRAAMAAPSLGEMRHRVTSPLDGFDHFTTATLDPLDVICRSLTTGIQFSRAIQRLYARGVTGFVECTDRELITKMVSETVPRVRTIAPLDQAGREITEIRRAASWSQTPDRSGISRDRALFRR